MYDFSKFDAGMSHIKDWFKSELSAVRTGRATPALLDNIKVDVYGAQTPLAQIASVSVEDARTLIVSPYDNTQVKPIEKSLTVADLGISISAGDTSLRISFPELTGERRDALMKVVKDKMEQGRVSVKTERGKAIDEIEKMQKDGDISEDEMHRLKDDVQKKVDAINEELSAMAEKKEKEISE